MAAETPVAGIAFLTALKAIAEGYAAQGDGLGEFVQVENPKFRPDDGSDPFLVIDVAEVEGLLFPEGSGRREGAIDVKQIVIDEIIAFYGHNGPDGEASFIERLAENIARKLSSLGAPAQVPSGSQATPSAAAHPRSASADPSRGALIQRALLAAHGQRKMFGLGSGDLYDELAAALASLPTLDQEASNA